MSTTAASIHIMLIQQSTETKTGSNKPVPWQNLAKNTDKYCDDSVFPDGFTFMDPIKLKIEPATLLLDHWFQRQTDAQLPFTFKGATMAVAKGKKLDYVELDKEDEETDKEEEETDEGEDEMQTCRHQKGRGRVVSRFCSSATLEQPL
jgi:hypothetical protein